MLRFVLTMTAARIGNDPEGLCIRMHLLAGHCKCVRGLQYLEKHAIVLYYYAMAFIPQNFQRSNATRRQPVGKFRHQSAATYFADSCIESGYYTMCFRHQ